ncbi:lysylphosphatidylglycerol synthase domain-containing protein [Sphaerisporangium sp. TRM90804]|uniref:lysylphosphatidylglycerol synthase domain-containing protein n=1 Tax=Sphaerisporangium sp. TRM90804 TaxID=3031113 RepID=UPI002446BB86|nr:lysylphosphatidylglycerol synthase domain-containing protein [Sphaerisporangium sp. TRM90804]MDH2427823.1 lysylphosphatidylglycerol synthase domain-containing protein [Sphaerisporangium sp. TRM90804]
MTGPSPVVTENAATPAGVPPRRSARGKAVRLAFLAVALGFGAWAVSTQWAEVSDGFSRLSWPYVVGALAAVLAALAAGMLMWRSLLADLGSPLPFLAAAKVFFVGQLGKYIPGSLWPVLAQMEMGRDLGVPRPRSAAAFFLTYPIYMATGLTVAAVTLPAFAGDSAAPYAWLLVLLPVVAAGLHPRVVNAVLGFGLRRLKRPPLEHPLTRAGVLASVGWAFAGWLFYGTHLALIVAGLGATGPRAAILSFGAIALAWCLQFVVVVVPAGAGVREVAMIAVLAPVLDPGSAIAAALCSRLVVTAGDLVCAGLAGLAARRAPGVRVRTRGA